MIREDHVFINQQSGIYNTVRTHWSLGKDAPLSRPIQRIGRITYQAILGGLHHEYVRN